ncbi:hypothetical protein M422DRAFT_246118 [Sphaerobolus stellatus SS14]|nr:hypothetical protein M422DRAFT_246118 [Sphaerobolus stellatus SS14]
MVRNVGQRRSRNSCWNAIKAVRVLSEGDARVGRNIGSYQVPALSTIQKGVTAVLHMDEILDQIHEAWLHVSGYITKIGDECKTLEKELFQEKADNHPLCNDLDNLKERLQELEAQLSSLQAFNTVSEHSMMLTSPTNYSSAVSNVHPLASPIKVMYSHKRSHKLDENADFRNRILKPDE